ncbi:hypothetical protein ACHWQZ_G018197 [Mnemiopsis leidyi]
MVHFLKSILHQSLIVYFLPISLTFKCDNIRQTCYTAFTNETHNALKRSPTIVPINFTGVVTVEVAYIPDYTARWEYIRFMHDKDLEPLVLQFFTPTKKYTSSVSIFGEDKIGPYPYSEYEVYSLFDDVSQDIIIQISDVHVSEDNFYRIYLGEPGSAHSINYNYQNQENWDALSFMRFNTTTQIKTDNKAIYFKSVSVCLDDTPELCGDTVEIVAVSRGDSFNLSCSVYGAPYLEAIWSNVTAGNFAEQAVNSNDGFLHTSGIYVGSFDGDHAGEWKCYWRNKNLGTVSATKTFHVVEILSRPFQKTFVIGLQERPKNRTLEWEIKKSPCFESKKDCETQLDCRTGDTGMGANSIKSHKNITIIDSLVLPESVMSDKITCSLYLVTESGEKLGVLDTTTLYREGYHCEEGYYGVGEECLECPENFTSSPRSTKCFPSHDVSFDENGLPPDAESDNYVAMISSGVAVLILIVLCVVIVWFKNKIAATHETFNCCFQYSKVPSSRQNNGGIDV